MNIDTNKSVRTNKDINILASSPLNYDNRSISPRHKRDAVASAPPPEDAPKPPATSKHSVALSVIEKAMHQNPLFKGLGKHCRRDIALTMTFHSVERGAAIIRQGDPDGAHFYIIDQGTCQVSKLGIGVVAHLGPGQAFGELALLYNSPRSATVTSITPCSFWVMERKAYTALRRMHERTIAAERKKITESASLFRDVHLNHRAIIGELLELVEFDANETILQEGEDSEAAYLVHSGRVRVHNGLMVGPGDCFGAEALRGNPVYMSTATSLTESSCFKLKKQAVKDVLAPFSSLLKYPLLCNVPALSTLSERQLMCLSSSMEEACYGARQEVFHKGDPGDAFYIITSGSFEVTDEFNQVLAICKPGECFGELALLRKEPRAATVTAASADCSVLKCCREVFYNLLGPLPDIQNLWRYEALRKMAILAPLSREQLFKLCLYVEQKHFEPGQIVLEKGQYYSSALIVERGDLAIEEQTGAKPLLIKCSGSHIGEDSLLSTRVAVLHTVRSVGHSTVLLLSKATLEKAFGDRFTAYLAAAVAARKVADETDVDGLSEERNLSAQEFEFVRLLGSGAFGKVCLVRRKGFFYALKSLNKAHLQSAGLAHHVERERTLMVELKSPFIVKLKATFEDADNIYLVLEPVFGGDLFGFLQSASGGLMSESSARFYLGCVILGLEFMHARGIAWRDLKPENLLIDATNGYLKLADFGFAKRMGPGHRSYTLCGTPEYLAPELVTSAGHGPAVDWWSLGVLAYELIAGKPPFGGGSRVSMFKSICAADYEFPDTFSKV